MYSMQESNLAIGEVSEPQPVVMCQLVLGRHAAHVSRERDVRGWSGKAARPETKVYTGMVYYRQRS